jgi:pimeloyl-ACP methyl ester carboxylesterase
LLKDRGGRVFAKLLHTLDAVRILGKREKETGEKFLIPLYPPWIFDYLGYDTRKDAPHVHVPVFVISAGGDLVVASPDVHEDLARRFPDAVHAIIPHASHTFHEHEAALADTITAWLT